MLDKKNIRKFGKVYDYLKDGKFRFKEAGKQRFTITGAEFSEYFKQTSWEFFDFVDCDFQSNSYSVTLDWLADCTFINCRFHGNFGWGQVKDVHFLRCEVTGKSGETHFGSSWKTKNLVFEDCTFSNYDSDPNYRCSTGSTGEVMFIGCKGKNFSFVGYKKLTLRNCTTQMGVLITDSHGMHSDESYMSYSDFLLEDCDLRGGVEMTNANLNTFTMRRCKLREFRLSGAVIRGNALIEEISEGYLRAAANYKGKLVIRNCSFMGIKEQENSFEVSACTPTHTLLENITCGRKPVDIVRRKKPRTEWADPPQSKLIVVKDCKIPHLQVNWAQTERLLIENCEFDSLHIQDGRIGELEIIGCSLSLLNVSRTQVKKQNVRVREGGKYSGHVTITEGSNIELLPRN